MTKEKSVQGEVGAMAVVENALEPLGPDERGRVLRWAAERFGILLRQDTKSFDGKVDLRNRGGSLENPTDVGEFYAQAAPTTEPERALVVSYWVQEVQGAGEFDSQTVNTQLKHLGHGVSNITRALDDLKNQKPQLVIQIQKSGKAKQARKRYKVTAAGRTEVQRMLTGKSEE
jgi:hypothetical protein